MSNIHTYLHTMKNLWLKQSAQHREWLGPFWLSPQQRYALLEELMAPVSQQKKTH